MVKYRIPSPKPILKGKGDLKLKPMGSPGVADRWRGRGAGVARASATESSS